MWPAPDSGRLLEVRGDAYPRGMTARDRTRLIGELVDGGPRKRGSSPFLEITFRINYRFFITKKS